MPTSCFQSDFDSESLLVVNSKLQFNFGKDWLTLFLLLAISERDREKQSHSHKDY